VNDALVALRKAIKTDLNTDESTGSVRSTGTTVDNTGSSNEE
jgi:hypothetical protein